MEIKYKEVSDYIPKSTGYMLTLMRGQDLPLVNVGHFGLKSIDE